MPQKDGSPTADELRAFGAIVLCVCLILMVVFGIAAFIFDSGWLFIMAVMSFIIGIAANCD